MSRRSRVALLSLSLLLAPDALAQTPPPKPAPPPARFTPPAQEEGAAGEAASKLTPAELQALREQVRAEVMQEVDDKLVSLREEVRDEARAAATTAAAADSWEAEWEDVTPQLQFFQPAGYLRLRMALWKDADLGLPRSRTPAPWFSDAINPADNGTVAQADMRLRFEPTLNVSEEVRIKTQIDFLDNLVLGSTADGTLGFGEANNVIPGGFLSQTQLTPDDVRRVINVRRAWGEVVTPVGELRFGRMGANWGLGIFANDGNCFDCDFGDTVDRIMFATRIANHVIAPALDFVSEGPITPNPYAPLGEPYDAAQVDDGRDLVLAVLRRDTDEEIRKLRAAGTELFINYGLYLVYRSQNYSAVPTDAGEVGYVKRDANAVIPDVWFRLLYRKYRLEIEALTIQGKIRNRAETATQDPSQTQSLDLDQWGAVIQNELKVADDKLALRLELGFASGDAASGFGNLGTSNGGYQGPQYRCDLPDCSDDAIQNLRFDRDYRIDMLLWREILGGVTDTIYVRPSLTYALTEGLNLDLAIIYSQAVKSGSTPTNDAPLGLEIDAGASYLSDDGFLFGLRYGVLFPFSGLSGLTDPTDPNSTVLDTSTAQALRGAFGIVY